MAITFHSNGRSTSVENRGGALLAELAAEAGMPLNMQCGGQGACRGCMVNLIAGRVQVGETVVDEPSEIRACKAVVLSDEATIEVPARSLLSIGECASADFYATRKNLFHPPSLKSSGVTGPLKNNKGAGSACLGIAVDIGTTTVAAILVDLATGKILARESAYNRQIEMADNIASCIALCADIENAAKLQKLIIEETIFPMFGKLSEKSFQGLENVDATSSSRFQCLEKVTQIVFSGNTVMSHLALGLSPLCIGTIPFEPLTKIYSEHSAPEIGLTNCPNAKICTVPSIAGYVGGDIVSDLCISEMADDRFELLVDIGTNGEIVLNDHGTWMATATAAGPAFEGAGLLHGTRAAAGVIDRIECHADDSINLHIIGDQPPTGLCGSAAVDFMASAFKTGLLNEMGRFDLDRLKAAGRFVELDCSGMTVNACVLVPVDESGLDESILITEFDISQILKAKAAIYAGIRTLLDRAGRSVNDIERLVLAGGFAAHLRIPNAILIGLLPELSLERYEVVGNGSLAGAYAALGSSEVWKELQQISEKPDTCHLAETNEFNDRFVDALALPNLDSDEFPNTAKKMFPSG